MENDQKLELIEAVRKSNQIYFDSEAPDEAKDEAMLELRAALRALDGASDSEPTSPLMLSVQALAYNARLNGINTARLDADGYGYYVEVTRSRALDPKKP